MQFPRNLSISHCNCLSNYHALYLHTATLKVIILVYTTSHIYYTHTHKNSLKHTHTTHIYHLHTYIHINSPTIAFPSLSYFLFLCSLIHSITPSLPYPLPLLTPSFTHAHYQSLTCACTYIHKKSTTIIPPSLLYLLFPSCFSMLSLSLEKLVTCRVIRSYNFFLISKLIKFLYITELKYYKKKRFRNFPLLLN